MDYLNENQKTSDCAIVGVYNALIWLNKKVSYNKIEKIAKKYYKYSPKTGLKYRFLKDFTDYMNVSIKPFNNATIQEVEKTILEGKAALAMITRKSDKVKHIVFLKPNNRTIEVLNQNMSWIELVLGFKKQEIKLDIWSIE